MDLLNMINRPKCIDFIRRLNRGNFVFQTKVLKFSDLLGVWKLAINAKFQYNISPKLLQLGKKHRDMGCECL